MFKLVLCVSLLGLLSYSSADELVPLLAWSNSGSLSKAQGQSSLSDIFSEVKISDFKLAVVLKSSSLSFDDIARYGGVYGEKNAPLSGLRRHLSSSPSSLSAGVSGPSASDLTSMLSFAMDTAPIYVPDIDHFPEFVGSGPYLVVMEMPEAEDEESFKVHDSIITKMVPLLAKANLPYTIFYTADSAENPAHHLGYHANNVRRATSPLSFSNENEINKICYTVVDTESKSCSVVNGTCPSCLLMCLTGEMYYENVRREGNETVHFMAKLNDTDSITMTGGSCGTYGVPDLPQPDPNAFFSYMSFELLFRVENTTETIKKTMFFTFVRGTCKEQDGGSNRTDCGFWTMDFFAGDSASTLEHYPRNHSRLFSPLAIPLTNGNLSSLSYACGNNTFNNFTRTKKDSRDTFKLTGLQVEPFAQLEARSNQFSFGSAYNCQGYFSMGSWMGVVSVLILLLILYISSVFIFSIQTIDRFDDPRGETIKVENLH